MWVPVVSLVWTFMYLAESRFGSLTLPISDTESVNDEEPQSQNPQGNLKKQKKTLITKS